MHESTREQPPCGRYLSVGAIALLLLGGCSDLLGVRSKEFGGVKSAAVLAQYRLVTVRPRQAESTPANVTCTEPNPDVALAISGALSASAKSTAGASADVAAQYGESIAQLGKRYATVSILSNMLFRDCEDFANGAINEVEYAYRMSRFGGLVVTLFALESVGGGNAPGPVKVSQNSNDTGGGDGNDNGNANGGGAPSGQANPNVKKSGGGTGNVTASTANITKAVADTKNTVQSAEQAVTKADSDIKALSAVPASTATDKALVAALKKNSTDADSALKLAQTALADLSKIKSGAKTDDAAQKAVQAATSAADNLNFSANTKQAAISKTSAIKSAGGSVDAAQTTLKSAAKSLADLQKTIDTAATAGPNPNGGSNSPQYQSISDAQAKAIAQIQWNYMRLENLQPDVIACATVISNMAVGTSGDVIEPTDKISALQYICRGFLGRAGTLSSNTGEKQTSQSGAEWAALQQVEPVSVFEKRSEDAATLMEQSAPE